MNKISQIMTSFQGLYKFLTRPYKLIKLKDNFFVIFDKKFPSIKHVN